MQTVTDFEEANRKKVAVREWVEKTMYDRRKLDSVMLTNRTSLRTEEYQLLKSLDVTLRNEADEDMVKTLTWTPISSSEQFTVIKVHFEDDVNTFAPLADELLLTVTFWGVDLFQSREQHSVRFGTQLHWSIFRQISEDEKQALDLVDYSTSITVGIVLLFLTVLLLGKSLAFWMFVNSLQLVAHLPLLNTVIPANLHQFLRKYLDLVRLNFFAGDDGGASFGSDSPPVPTGDPESNEIYSSNNTILQICGYAQLFFDNAGLILLVLMAICIIWALVAAKKVMPTFRASLQQSIKQEQKMSNFTIRFIYEIFFELAICCMISLSLNETGNSRVQWAFSVIVFALLMTLPIFLLSQLCCGGPYISNHYGMLKCSVLCCWQSRSRNYDLQCDEYDMKK